MIKRLKLRLKKTSKILNDQVNDIEKAIKSEDPDYLLNVLSRVIGTSNLMAKSVIQKYDIDKKTLSMYQGSLS